MKFKMSINAVQKIMVHAQIFYDFKTTHLTYQKLHADKKIFPQKSIKFQEISSTDRSCS